MTAPRWIPCATLALVLAGCTTPAQDVGRLVFPDQFHLYYETSDADIDSQVNPGRGFASDRDALLFGLSWDLSTRTPFSREDMRALILELRQPAPVAASAPAPEPSAEPEPPPAPVEASAELVALAEPEPEPPAEPVALAEPEPEPLPEPPPIELTESVPLAPIAPSEPEPEPAAAPVELAPTPAPPSAPSPEASGWVLALSSLGVLAFALAVRLETRGAHG